MLSRCVRATRQNDLYGPPFLFFLPSFYHILQKSHTHTQRLLQTILLCWTLKFIKLLRWAIFLLRSVVNLLNIADVRMQVWPSHLLCLFKSDVLRNPIYNRIRTVMKKLNICPNIHCY